MSWQLHVALVQVASSLDPTANRGRLSELAELTSPGADLVVYPEAFARDFGKAGSPLGEFAEPVDGPFGTELARVAAERHTTMVAGTFEPSDDPDKPYNSLVVAGAVSARYRKIHLYDSFGYRESDVLTGGPTAPTVVEIGGAPVGLMTCYDLRFPEMARALVDAGAEVIVVPAAWVAGERKVDHWRTLVRARAIENTAYVVAAGQPGPRYCGHSMVVDPLGDILVEASEHETEVVEATIEGSRVAEARRLNPSLANRRL